MIAESARRVASNTREEINKRIRTTTRCSLAYYARYPEEIGQRLRELDQEWDIERALETGSSVLSLVGLTMSCGYRKRWLLLPLAVQAFFLQHALQGWCPPLPLLRRLGFRTRAEIDQERYALKILRGDFAEAGKPGNKDHVGADELMEAVLK